MFQEPTTSTTKGLEVLTFQNSELTTSVDHSFRSTGPLRVIYFPSQVRFMLNINDWNYALTSRLPVTASSKNDDISRYYILPGPKGTFTLKINNFPTQAAIHNFDAVMNYSTSLSYKNEDFHDYHNTSMDAKLMAESHSIFDDHVAEASDVRLDVNDLMDNCEEVASQEKPVLAQELNTNMTEVKTIDEIKKTPESQVEAFELWTVQVMSAVERSREIEEKLNDSMVPSMAFTYDRATADTLTTTLEKLVDEHSAILYSPEDSKINRSVSSIIGLSGLAAKSEEELLNEISAERKIQEEARRLQAEAREQELDSIMKERKAREELMTEAMFEDYDVLEINQKERDMIEEVNDVKAQISLYEEELMTERSEAKQREAELRGELKKLALKLAEKEELANEKRKALRSREKVLSDLIFHCESYTREVEEKCKELLQRVEEKEQELKERLEDVKKMAEENKEQMGVDKNEWQVREKEVLEHIKSEEKLLKRETKEYKRMQKMLEKETKLRELRKTRLEDTVRMTEENIANAIQEIKNKEEQIEKSLEEIIRKENKVAFTTMEVEMGLEELREQDTMTSIKAHAVEIRQEALERDFAELKAEEDEFLSKVQEFEDLKESREKTLEARNSLINGRKTELFNELFKIENELEVGKIEYNNEAATLEELLLQKENDIEEARIENELKKTQLELLVQRNVVIFEKVVEELAHKEQVREQELMELRLQREATIKLNELAQERRLMELEVIKAQQQEMLSLTEEIVMGHKEVIYEIEKAEWEVGQPMEFQKELEMYFAGIQLTECMQDTP